MPSSPGIKFKYPIWNPAVSAIDVAADWGAHLFPYTADKTTVLQQPMRVAAVPVLFDQPESWTFDPSISPEDLSKFDLVLFSDPEYTPVDRVKTWIRSLSVNSWLLATSAWTTSDHSTIYRPYYIRPYLARNESHKATAADKPYLFDALLGARRPHRDYVIQALDTVGLLDQSIVTYRDCFPGQIINQLSEQVSAAWPHASLRWPYVSPHLDPSWEVAAAINNQCSFICPREIFARSWYSIICETLYTGSDFFLSEKSIKAMHAGRVFVLFGPCNYLATLRAHGFATFTGIIDETYDSDARDLWRYRKAMSQVMQLAWFEDPREVYQAAAPRLQQNQDRLAELEQKRERDLAKALRQVIPPCHWAMP